MECFDGTDSRPIHAETPVALEERPEQRAAVDAFVAQLEENLRAVGVKLAIVADPSAMEWTDEIKVRGKYESCILAKYLLNRRPVDARCVMVHVEPVFDASAHTAPTTNTDKKPESVRVYCAWSVGK